MDQEDLVRYSITNLIFVDFNLDNSNLSFSTPYFLEILFYARTYVVPYAVILHSNYIIEYDSFPVYRMKIIIFFYMQIFKNRLLTIFTETCLCYENGTHQIYQWVPVTSMSVVPATTSTGGQLNRYERKHRNFVKHNLVFQASSEHIRCQKSTKLQFLATTLLSSHSIALLDLFLKTQLVHSSVRISHMIF